MHFLRSSRPATSGDTANEISSLANATLIAIDAASHSSPKSETERKRARASATATATATAEESRCVRVCIDHRHHSVYCTPGADSRITAAATARAPYLHANPLSPASVARIFAAVGCVFRSVRVKNH